MRKQLKSMLVLILCLSVALSDTQVQAKVYKGKWENIAGKKTISWQYDNRTKRLTISGRGKMLDGHYNDEATPQGPEWKRFQDFIRELVISDGVTSVGDEMLDSAKNLSSVKLANSVREIGSCAFGDSYGAKKLKKINLPPYLEK